jgi:hypothetical protein
MHPIKELDDKLDDVIAKLERVTVLSDILKDKIDHLEELEQRVSKVENFQSYVKGIMISVSIIAASLSSFIVDLIKKVI